MLLAIEPTTGRSRDVLDEGFGHLHRPLDIDAENLLPVRVVDFAEAARRKAGAHPAAATHGAGTVEQDVDRAPREPPRRRIDALVVGDIEPLERHAAPARMRQRREVGGSLGPARAGDHLPAARRVLARELEAEPAVRTGDEDSRHDAHLFRL